MAAKKDSKQKFIICDESKKDLPEPEASGGPKFTAVAERRMADIIRDPNSEVKDVKAALDIYAKLIDVFGPSIIGVTKPFEPSLFEYQRRFVESRARYTAMIGGVRSGKTYAGAVKAFKKALLLPTVGAAVAPTAAMARDVLVPQYAELAEGRVRKWNGSVGEMALDNGSKIMFRSADNPERLMGLTLDWFHLDEAAQLPKRVWEVLVNRTISTGGPGFLTTTPCGRNWLWELVKDWENDPDTEIIFAKTADNPLIDAIEIERARRQLDARYFRQQYEASFEAEGLRVYEDFEPEIHILGEPWQIQEHWPIYIGIDFGWTHPTAIIWAQLSPDDEWFIFDELVESHLRLESVAAAILGGPVNVVGRTFRACVPYSKVERVISGAEGKQSRQEGGGESALSVLAGMGVSRTLVSRGRIIDGIHAVRAKLRSANNNVGIRIDPRCKRLIDDFLGYQYAAGSDGKPIGELPEKDGIHDHTMDALRYMIAQITPLKSQEWRFG